MTTPQYDVLFYGFFLGFMVGLIVRGPHVAGIVSALLRRLFRPNGSHREVVSVDRADLIEICTVVREYPALEPDAETMIKAGILLDRTRGIG